jgi:3-hydroxyacyl-[acyl-carrier-protein] dehydratase
MTETVTETATETASKAQSADIRYIMEVLPHRYPLLLVDRILEYEPYKYVRGYKNVSANEPFSQGHFPGNPVLPGVYMIEAMAQLSGVAVLLPGEFMRKVPYLVGIDKVKFRRPVYPGDQLMMEATLLRVRGPIIWVTANAKVDDNFVVSAELMFSVTSDQRGFPLDASILHE